MMKLCLFLLILSQATSDEFLARGDDKEVPNSQGNEQPAAFVSGGDSASAGDGADDASGDSSGVIISVPLGSELQTEDGKVTAAALEQSASAASNGHEQEEVSETQMEENAEQQQEEE